MARRRRMRVIPLSHPRRDIGPVLVLVASPSKPRADRQQHTQRRQASAGAHLPRSDELSAAGEMLERLNSARNVLE
jgi:hypothetical protein